MNGMERFEAVAEAYINATPEAREKALALMDENERKTFLEGVGLYRMFRDPVYYDKCRDYLAMVVWNEAHK